MQDYQLQLVPQMLRELRPDLRIGFYLHIPFPPAELFQQLPWRRQILEGLLGADLVGFQLPGRRANFVRLVRQRVGHKTHRDPIYLPDGRTVQAARVPDLDRHRRASRSWPAPRRSTQRAKEIREALGNPRKIFLGVDRLDYTKGIYAAAARVRRADRRRPARRRGRGLRAGRDALARAGRAVPRSCATTSTGWSAGSTATSAGSAARRSRYLHSSYPREEMAALYRAADIMVVTPFRDGMNLVAKEYVACRYDDDGALVLSEFAGARRRAAAGLPGQPLRHQRHEGRAARGLPAPTRRSCTRRMRAMRKTVAEHDVAALGRRAS